MAAEVSRSGVSAAPGAPAPRCAQCGATLRPRRGRARSAPDPLFCCYGCVLVSQIAGSRGERAEPSWILARLGLSAFLAMNVMGLSLVLYAGDAAAQPGLAADASQVAYAGLFRHALLVFSAPVLLLLGWPILDSGLRGFGRPGAGVDSLIALGALAAFALSAWATLRGSGPVYYETACMVLVLLTLGRYLEAQARTRAAAALSDRLPAQPAAVSVLREGRWIDAPPETVAVGDLVRVLPGALVPVDGTVVDGEGGVDESTLTGEPLPARRAAGDTLYAATVSVDGAFHLRVTATGSGRLAARIARLLEQARAARAPIELLADRVAAAFVPLAVGAALAAGTYWTVRAGVDRGLMNGLSVLLIACPCALGLATPLAVWEAVGSAARRGILIRSGEALERLASIRKIFFDKTGTLTDGRPRLERIVAAHGVDEEEVLAVAAAVEAVCGHPLARAVAGAARERGLEPAPVRRFRIHPGVGVEGEAALPGGGFRCVAVGGREMLRRLGAAAPEWAAGGSAGPAGPEAFVISEGRVIGALRFAESLRPGAEEALDEIRRQGLGSEILTGDRAAAGQHLAARLGVEARGDLSAGDKVAALASGERDGGPAAMVGEGINDAPALARAGVSIALGGGAVLSQEAADITLLGDDLGQIPWLVALARRTLRAIRINLFWAFLYNVVLIPLAMAGRLQPILAVLAMIGSSLFVVTRSLVLGRDEDAAASRRGAGRGALQAAEAQAP